MLYFIVFGPILIVVLILAVNYYLKERKREQNIILLSKLDVVGIINEQNKINNKLNPTESAALGLQLIQAGITLKEYNEGRLVLTIIGLVLIISLVFVLPFSVYIVCFAIGIVSIILSGKIYIYIAKSERIEKIDRDLGTFLDLVNVILEAGGSLKNAFFTVSTRAKGIIDDELLKEIGILEYEMTNYSTKQAYENLKKRVDSEQMDKIVDFLILSEETGIGVKNIFTTQSTEMRQDKFYKIKGKVNTLNMYLMIVIFVFILPAVGAFIVFPMKAGAIASGF
jgi:tight adherence protein C